MEDFEHAYQTRSVRLRYFNAAGADPAAEIGEWHTPETHLIPLIFDAVLARRPPISIFGTDYPTPDGTAERDYIHVMDLAEAHIAALCRLLDGGASAAINLGSGRAASVREVIRAVESVTGRTVPAVEAPRRAGDPPALVADASAAAELLGWRARAESRADRRGRVALALPPGRRARRRRMKHAAGDFRSPEWRNAAIDISGPRR